MQAAYPALLAELLMAGSQPSKAEDQPPERRRPQTGPATHQQSHKHEPQPRGPQPPRGTPHPGHGLWRRSGAVTRTGSAETHAYPAPPFAHDSAVSPGSSGDRDRDATVPTTCSAAHATGGSRGEDN